jgi:hypothetical protein
VVRLGCGDRGADVDCEGRAKLILDSRSPPGRDFATGRLGFVTDLLPPQSLMSPRPRTPEQRASSDQARRNPDTLTVCDALDLLLKPTHPKKATLHSATAPCPPAERKSRQRILDKS